MAGKIIITSGWRLRLFGLDTAFPFSISNFESRRIASADIASFIVRAHLIEFKINTADITSTMHGTKTYNYSGSIF